MHYRKSEEKQCIPSGRWRVCPEVTRGGVGVGLRRPLAGSVLMNARVANNLVFRRTSIHTVSLRGAHLVHSHELAHHTPSLLYITYLTQDFDEFQCTPTNEYGIRM